MKKLIFIPVLFLFFILSCYITYSQLPDSDGDGVFDNEDACPFVKGVKENKGCPLQNSNQNKVITSNIQPPKAAVQLIEFLKAENLNQVIDQLYNDAVSLLKQLISTPSFSKEEDRTAAIIEQFFAVKNIPSNMLLNTFT